MVFEGQWNAPTSLKNCLSAKAYFPELLRLSSTSREGYNMNSFKLKSSYFEVICLRGNTEDDLTVEEVQ